MRLLGRAALFIACVAISGAAFSLTYAMLGPKEPPGRPSDAPAGVVLAPGAEAVIHYLLGDGRVAATDVTAVPDALVGLTLPELQTARPEWRIVSFAPERVVASVACGPVSGTAGFIGAKDGKVAVFRGRPEGCHELEELTGIDAGVLGVGARADSAGVIPFDDPSEVPHILEGLTGQAL